MPRWDNPDDYQFTSNLSKEGWAWEFLRRNPDYINDYKKACEQDQLWVNHGVRRDNPHSVYKPVRKEGESLGEWNRRCSDDKYKSPREYRPRMFYGQKWHLKNHVQDPHSDLPPDFVLPNYPRLLDYDEVDRFFGRPDNDEYGPAIQSTSIMIVCLNLEEPRTQQVKDLRTLFSNEKAKLDNSNSKTGSKLSPNRKTMILRYIDSVAAGISAENFCNVAYKNHDLARSGDDPQEITYSLSKYAKKLSSPTGYLTLFLKQ